MLERFLAGDERALARGISLVEAGAAEGLRLLEGLGARTGHARLLGITGSPGSGKSTLVDQLIVQARVHQRKVAVLAVDPTSPFSGGALLGDRIRMMQHHQDSGVYIRSMATKGYLGGLAASTLQVARLLDAFGFDDILIETVGVGQSEVEIVNVADLVLLVLSPGQGDGVQAFKAGIMEIADVFVINKADLPGAGRLKREIQAALELGYQASLPPILETVALAGTGVAEVYDAIGGLYSAMQASGRLEQRQRRRLAFELRASFNHKLAQTLALYQEQLLDDIQQGHKTPEVAFRWLLEQIKS